ncbi:MAG: bifunctional riboflavin kinase/FAD synthetase [Deltaproteobacteria bacterium]|nr:bifunctional riboflavin kinase/FAD synthetase [Deltaproteobacteria bacterium]MBW2020772.1 bifunctional riboflavin kinase/FAD synthetase [Deltaproteobacteria bacterium]MBW2075374.1 bifunctional riboflavin kinase/FAD synthetase [Deltaproteobacteria bacterium]RLB80492.1 MAG: riboflavin biosynthesis protein RibF [Deltaproteobacteria bacterium]
MHIIKDLNEISKPLKKAVVAIGNFDGVHIGHQALFHQVIEKAQSIDGTSIVITFEPHPLRVINSNKHFPLITLYEQKVELIGTTGVNTLICIQFTREFAATPAHTFVKEILCDLIGIKAIIVGQDYSFGRNREGDVSLLKEMGATHGFEVIISDWVELEGRRISSTEIRNLVGEGRVEEAKKLLGRYYQVRGNVIRGRDRGGKLLGFPTANLTLSDELCPKTGVYAVTVEHDKARYKGVANIGYSPTFQNGLFSVEVHILDFDKVIYDQPIRLNFVRRLRDEKKFSGPEALAAQIRRDIETARGLLSSE